MSVSDSLNTNKNSLTQEEDKDGKSVLILSTYASSGGAAIAAKRLMDALNNNDIEACMLCRRNISWGPKALQKQSWTSIWERLGIFIRNGFSQKNLWAMDTAFVGQDILQTKEYREADVIHLHWVNQGFLSLDTIEKMVHSGKRVIWTMHDAWNSTGGCHLTLGCEKYKSRCGSCKYLRGGTDDADKDVKKDLSTAVWERKRKLYKSKKIQFVTCSEWLRNEVKGSSLMKDQSITAIPNPIDTAFYFPQDKKKAREVLHLPQDKHLALFVAQNVSNPYKGMKYLIEAAKQLEGKDVELVMLGNGGDLSSFGGVKVNALGYIRDAETIRMAYSAVDVFVLPSLSENLPNTIMEAMACGTPCVGFRIGGIPEMIDHLQNGYVANYCDAEDLAKGIEKVLFSDEAKGYGEACIAKVKDNYSEEAVAKRYIELYKGTSVTPTRT